MLEGNYRKKVYSTLKKEAGLTISEEEFDKRLNSDPSYKKKVYSTLSKDMGLTISEDEFNNRLKKKESSEPTSQAKPLVSSTKPTQPSTSLATEGPTRAAASASLDGPTKPFRLANESDLETMQKRGILPPPSELPVIKEEIGGMYDLKTNRPEVKKQFKSKTEKVRLPGQRTAQEMSVESKMTDENLKDFVEKFRDDEVTGELGYNNKYKIEQAKLKIRENDLDLEDPYVYFSVQKQKENPDNFIQENYSVKELSDAGINIEDFDGFLNKKGYKDDFIKKKSEGLFEGSGKSSTGYDISLANELAKKRMLDLYIEDKYKRDYLKQDINQDILIATGDIKEKSIQKNQLFDQEKTLAYIENNFPVLTKKLKEKDEENAKLYEEAKKGGTDFFSWDTVSKLGKSGWNSLTDRINQFSATTYDALGADATAEGIRMLDEQEKLLRPNDRGVSYVSGKKVQDNGVNYIVDSKGDIYDADSKIIVTDLFNEQKYKSLVEQSRQGEDDWIFSTQGAAVQTSAVVTDMLFQAALTKGIGTAGSIGSGVRGLASATRGTSRVTSVLNDTSKLLKSIPIEKATGYSMIAQGAMGYSQGYEDTLKAARDAGIDDKEAFELAANAGQRMAVLYSTTGAINPQTNVVDNLFGSKNIIKKAIEQYGKTGKKGFVGYIDDLIKNTPRNLVDFAEEGGKEVIQENVQQVGEIGVNKMTNLDAGQKIMNEVMSGDDFMNTSILSFISSGLISKAKLPTFFRNDAKDDLTSLSVLSKNRDKIDGVLNNLVLKGVFTKDQSEKLKQDVDIYTRNSSKLPKKIAVDIAMPIMRELDKIEKLNEEKKNVDKVFHDDIDRQISSVENKIKDLYKSTTEVITEPVVETTPVKVILNKKIDIEDSENRKGLVPISELEDFIGEDRLGEAQMETSRETIDKLKEDISKNGFKEPIVLVYDKFSDGGEASIIEGNHRIIAAKELGFTEIPVIIEKGTLRTNEQRVSENMFPLKRKKIGVLNDTFGVSADKLGLSIRQPLESDFVSNEVKPTVTEIKETISEVPTPTTVTYNGTEYSKNEAGNWVNNKTGNEVKGIGVKGKALIAALNDMSPTETVVEQTATEQAPKTEIEEALDDIVRPKTTNIKDQVERAKKALAKIMKGVEIILHDTEESYTKATKDTSRGAYINGKIHLNPAKADRTSVAHEVFHAVLLKYVADGKPATILTNKMLKAVARSLKDKPELMRTINEFVKNGYKGQKEIWSEEKLAEVLGYLASEYETLPQPTKNIIQKWLEKIAIMLKMKPFTDKEVVDFMNTLAERVREGQEITEADVAIFINETSGGVVGNFNISREQKGVNAPKAKEDPRSFIRKFVEDIDIREFNGEDFITNMYDYTNAGETELGKGFKINLFGGKGYVPYMMELNNKKIGDVSNLAAFNTKAQAETFIRNSQESGAKLFAPHSGTKSKSWQFQQHTFAELVDLVLDKNILSSKELIDTFNNSINSKAIKEEFSKFSEKYGKKINNFDSFKSDPKKIVDLLDIKNNLSPNLRKALNNSIASNKIFQKTIGINNVSEFYNKIMDPLNEGVSGGEIIGVVKFDPNTFEIVQTKQNDIDHHPSFGWTLLAKINGIYQPSKFYKSYDITESYTKYNKGGANVSIKSEEVDFDKKNVTSSAGAIPKVAKFNIKERRQASNDYKAISKEILTDKELNTVRASLRASLPDSFALEVLDAVSKKELLGYDSDLDTAIEDMIVNGTSINNVANILMQDEDLVEKKNITNKRRAIDYLLNIGLKGTISKTGQRAVSRRQKEIYLEEQKFFQETSPFAWAVDEVSPETLDKSTIVENEGTYGVVTPDGDIKGVFNPNVAKLREGREVKKGTIRELIEKAIAAGGIKLDNFDGRLTKIYSDNGFREVSRVPFNEEYAPEGWNKEDHGTPDVVAMIYDPEGKIEIEKKSFTDYDEAMNYRDSYVDEAISFYPNGGKNERRQQTSALDRAVATAKSRGFDDKTIMNYLVSRGYTSAEATKAVLKYNKTVAEKIREEEGVFTRAGRRKIAIALDKFRRVTVSKRAFNTKTGLQLREFMEGNIEAELREAMIAIKEYDKMRAEYNGDKNVLDEEANKFLNGKSANIPLEFKAIVGKFRTHIDNLTMRLIDTGTLTQAQADKFRSNIGQYVNRSYKVFDDPKWKDKVDDQMKEAVRNELRNLYYSLKGNVPTTAKDRKTYGDKFVFRVEQAIGKSDFDEDIILNKMIEDEINDMLTPKKASGFIADKNIASKDLSILKQKNLNIPLSVRQLMGEYDNAGQNYAKTVQKLSALVYQADLLNKMKDLGMGVFFFEENDPNRDRNEFDTPIASEGSKTMSPLNGLYTTKELARIFKEDGIGDIRLLGKYFGGDNGIGNAFMKAIKIWQYTLGLIKKRKTVYSVGGHFKNVLGNVELVLSNAYLDPEEYANAFMVLKNSNKGEFKKKMDEYIRLGIISSGDVAEIRKLFNTDSLDTFLERRINNNIFKKSASWVDENLKNLYQAEDDFFKILGYEIEMKGYTKAYPNKSKEEIQQIVSNNIKNILPNYNRIGIIGSVMRSVPILTTFISYQLESYRTAWNNMALAKQEIASGNKVLRDIGMKRVIGTVSTQAVKHFIMHSLGTVVFSPILSLMAAGDDEEEELTDYDKKVKYMNLMLPEYAKGDNVVITKEGNGEISYINFSSSDPRKGISNTVSAVIQGKDPVDGFIKGAKAIMEPFVSEDILKKAVSEMLDNETQTGAKIYEESDSDYEKSLKLTNFAWKIAQTGTYTSAEKILKSDDPKNEVLGQLTGYKTNKIDVKKNLFFRIKELKQYEESAVSKYKKANFEFDEGKIDKAERDKIQAQAQKSADETYNKMREYLKAASYFGAKDYEIDEAFEKNRVSDYVIKTLWSNEMPIID